MAKEIELAGFVESSCDDGTRDKKRFIFAGMQQKLCRMSECSN